MCSRKEHYWDLSRTHQCNAWRLVDVFLKVPAAKQMKRKKNNSVAPWGNSLKFLSWDDDNNDKDDSSKKLISSTIHEWYDAKHRKSSIEEIEFINSIKVTHCPYCGSVRFIKFGRYGNGYQRYNCKDCKGLFSTLTGTIFDCKKIPISEWIEYLIHLFEFHSITTSARDNRNAVSTGRYWLFKVFAVLEDIQDDIILEDKIYLDEMFFPVVKSKEVLKDGKKLKGISRNKIAVACAFDNHDHLYIKVEYTSKPSDTSTWDALGSHIQPGSHLIPDGERSHGVLIRNLNLSEEVYKTAYTLNLKDEDNPLDPINRLHALAKRFMKSHGGYNRDNLQDWMNLIWFILSKPQNRYEKIRKFFNIAVCTHKRVKYRDVMSKRSDE